MAFSYLFSKEEGDTLSRVFLGNLSYDIAQYSVTNIRNDILQIVVLCNI